MSNFNRRQFLQAAGAATAWAALPRTVGAATTSGRVVVVGGGFGGATVAKYLRLWGGDVEVTLVRTKPNPHRLHPVQSRAYRRAVDESHYARLQRIADQSWRIADAGTGNRHRSAGQAAHRADPYRPGVARL